MSKRAQATSTRKKAHRFATLEKRHRQKPQLFEAIERRERAQHARLAATRSSLANTARAVSSVERRRDEYLAIPSPAPSPAIPRAILATIAGSFVVPLLLALLSGAAHRQPAQAPVVASGTIVTRHPLAHASAAHLAPAHPIAHLAAAQAAHPLAAKRTPMVVARASHAERVNVAARTPAPRETPSMAGRFIASVLQSLFGAGPRALTSEAKHESAGARVALLPKSANQIAPHPLVAQPASPWSLSPDGTWVATVSAPASASGASFSASTGQLIELEPSVVTPNQATVTIGWSRAVTVQIAAQGASLTKTLPAPDASMDAFDVAAAAVGPHLVDVGWTPLDDAAQVSAYEVFRSSGEGDRPELVATLPASKHAYHDAAVSPDSRYRYSVAAETSDESIQASASIVQTPDALPSRSASVASGKGMFLYFSSLAGDPRNFRHYDPGEVISEAQRAGIHVIELRMARGACTMAQTQAAHAWLDRLIDAAASADIKLLAWTVPRRVTTKDLAETIAAAEYTTPDGNGFDGLALDLETGDNYMGDGSKARERMVQYIHDIRTAAGAHYLIVATVASPRFGHQADYPYAGIAQYADVLQPMEYWHYFDEAAHHEYGRGEVAQAAAAAVAQTRRLAGRDIPVNVAGQSVALEGTGAPSGREISWSLDASKSGGAIGETFFDWAGTGPDAWAAIQAFDW